MDDLNLQEILDEIDSKTFQEDEYGELYTIAQNRLRSIVETGEGYRKALYAKNEIGLPKYVSGDMVGMADGTGGTIRITSACVEDHPDYGYCWVYRYGIYFIPEPDLQLITPRGVR